VKHIIALLVGLAVVMPSLAEKRYVKDELTILLRSGPSEEHKILKGLKSGTHLQLLEQTEDGKYAKVATDKGLEGFVLNRFLQNEPISFEKLILTQRELDKTNADFQELKNKYAEVKKELAESKRDVSSLDKEKESQQKELEYIKKVSSSAISLDKKNQELMTQNEELKITVDTLKAENERLQNDRDINYLLVGGFLIVLGLFLGWLLPKLGGRKGDAWA